jgi:AraC-like DNA-binding protein
MRLPRLPEPLPQKELPLWPPLLATRGRGGESKLHAHHALHLLLALNGELRVRSGRTGAIQSCAGVLTPADVPHAIDARGSEVLLVFLDPESEVGGALSVLAAGSLRLLTANERDALSREADPRAIMQADGAAWCRRVLEVLGAELPPLHARSLHPAVRRLLRLLRAHASADPSLEALAGAVDLSPSRLMHVFTESVGIPLRPYIAWLKLQRAAAAISSGKPLAEAAHAAGFADASHMTRTFRRMLGAPPSELRPRAGDGAVAYR